MRLLALLALIVWAALHRRPPGGGGSGGGSDGGGGGDGPGGRPRGGDGDPEGRPSQQHGSINAGEGVNSAQNATQEVAEKGRPGGGGSGTTRPGEGSGQPTEPAGGTVTHGKNSLAHLRKHAQHIRAAARADGVEIPTGVSRPETQQAMKDYIQHVVDHPDRSAQGRYMAVEDAIWSQRGDLIIVQKPNGEWITSLSASRGGAAGGAPWNNPNPGG